MQSFVSYMFVPAHASISMQPNKFSKSIYPHHASTYPQPLSQHIHVYVRYYFQGFRVSGITTLPPPARTIRPSSSPKVNTSIHVIPPLCTAATHLRSSNLICHTPDNPWSKSRTNSPVLTSHILSVPSEPERTMFSLCWKHVIAPVWADKTCWHLPVSGFQIRRVESAAADTR